MGGHGGGLSVFVSVCVCAGGGQSGGGLLSRQGLLSSQTSSLHAS